MLNSHEETILNGLIGAVADRQQILANNLANVRTDGYVRKDLDFNSVFRDLKDADHKTVDFDRIINKAVVQDGVNKPTYETELAEMYENQLKYILLTRLNGHIYKHMEEATQSGRAV